MLFDGGNGQQTVMELAIMAEYGLLLSTDYG